jgi:hypothetical protein
LEENEEHVAQKIQVSLTRALISLAGTYDVGLRYNSTASSEKCLNSSHTTSSVFIIQVEPVLANII